MTRADAVLAGIALAEWKARAEAAEQASERKEHLLDGLSRAFTQQGRIVLAVGISIDGARQPTLYLQSNQGDEAETLARLSKSIAPYLKLVALTMRAESGKQAQAGLDRDAAGEVGELERELAEVEDERDHVRRLLADLVDSASDCPERDSRAWIAADRFIRGEK